MNNNVQVSELTTQALETRIKKLARLSSGRTFLESLKTTLCNMRDDSTTCKENFLTEITSADHELYYAAYYSLERTKLTVAATHAEELSRLKKLRRDLAKLNRRRADLLHATNDEEMNAAALKEAELSAKKLLECVKKLQQTAVLCEDSSFDKLKLAPNFASIQLHFKDLSLVTSDSGNVRKQLARLPIEAQTSKPIKQGYAEANWDLNPNEIFVKLLPEATAPCDVHEYFSKFGPITGILVPRHKLGPDSILCGFVTFLETESVRKVLETQPHQLGGNQIVVCMARKNLSCRKGSSVFHVSDSDEEDDDSSHSEDDKSVVDASPDQLTIRVKGAQSAVTESELTAYFSQFGSIEEVRVVRDLLTGESLGFGFVTFADDKAFKRGVLKACHFLGRSRLLVRLSVDSARSRGSSALGAIKPEKSLDWDLDPKRLFVGDLLGATEECDLYEYFSKFGIVTEATVLKNTRRSDGRCCGFVAFRDTDAAKRVLESQPHVLHETEITVSLAWSNKSADTGL
nr:unnamed protein product [Spirometra erinaceieuropaei]